MISLVLTRKCQMGPLRLHFWKGSKLQLGQVLIQVWYRGLQHKRHHLGLWFFFSLTPPRSSTFLFPAFFLAAPSSQQQLTSSDSERWPFFSQPNGIRINGKLNGKKKKKQTSGIPPLLHEVQHLSRLHSVQSQDLFFRDSEIVGHWIQDPHQAVLETWWLMQRTMGLPSHTVRLQQRSRSNSKVYLLPHKEDFAMTQ